MARRFENFSWKIRYGAAIRKCGIVPESAEVNICTAPSMTSNFFTSVHAREFAIVFLILKEDDMIVIILTVLFGWNFKISWVEGENYYLFFLFFTQSLSLIYSLNGHIYYSCPVELEFCSLAKSAFQRVSGCLVGLVFVYWSQYSASREVSAKCIAAIMHTGKLLKPFWT